jgi:hypothetical protein
MFQLEHLALCSGRNTSSILAAPPRFVTPVLDCDPCSMGWSGNDPPGGALAYSSATLAASLKIFTNISRVSLPVCVFWFDG